MSNNTLTVFDLESHEAIRHVGLPKRGPSTVFASPDGSLLFCLASGGCDVVVLDANTLAVKRIVKVPGTIVDRGKVPGQGHNFWVAVILQGHIHQIDGDTGEVLRTFEKAGPAFTVSDDEEFLYTLQPKTRKAPGAFRTISVATGEVLGEMPLPKGEGVPLGMWNTGTSAYWVEMAKSGGLQVVDVSDPKAPTHKTRVAVGTAPLGLEVMSNGTLWLPNSADGTVSVIDATSHRVLHTLDAGHYVGGISECDGKVYLNQTVRPGKIGFWRSMWITVPGPYVGTYVTSKSGNPRTRRFLDIPAEVSVYDLETYERLPIPAMRLPSIGFTSAVVAPA
jgi:DNA-binding beta-propeller fold protein YncE